MNLLVLVCAFKKSGIIYRNITKVASHGVWERDGTDSGNQGDGREQGLVHDFFMDFLLYLLVFLLTCVNVLSLKK